MVGWTRRNRESRERQEQRRVKLQTPHQFGSLTPEFWKEQNRQAQKDGLIMIVISIIGSFLLLGFFPLLVWLTK